MILKKYIRAILNEEIEKKIVVGFLPGGFKPPHSAHFYMAKKAASECDVLNILIGSSNNSIRVATGTSGNISITPKLSKEIWEIYSKQLPNIKISLSATPVRNVYEQVDILNKSQNAQSTVVNLYVGTQGSDAERYKTIQKYADNLAELNIKKIESPLEPTGTKMRGYIANNNKDMFLNGLPSEIGNSEKEKIWKICQSYMEEGLLRKIIGDIILEIKGKSASIVTEGGLGGHMMHPYENINLTFADLKELINDIGTGNIEKAVEKTDGQNLWISWKNGSVVAARNSSELKAGGLSFEQLSEKFVGRGTIYDAFTSAHSTLQKAFDNMDNKYLKEIFGNANNWISIEIIYPAAANVINYDKNTIILHSMTLFDDEGKEVDNDLVYPDIHPLLVNLIKKIENMQMASANEEWTIMGDVIHKIGKIEDKSAIQKLNSDLESIMNLYNLSLNNNLEDFMKVHFSRIIDEQEINIDEDTQSKILERIVNERKSAISFGELKTIFKNDGDSYGKIREILSDKFINEEKKKALKPIIDLFAFIGLTALKNIRSGLLANPTEEAKRLTSLIKREEELIRSLNDAAKIEKLERALSIIGTNKLESAIEGLSFKWKGNTYKITGLFAPINQILGILKYER